MALARALLSKRNILLLDEPTAHLDVETEYELKQTMLPLFEGKLVFLATRSSALDAAYGSNYCHGWRHSGRDGNTSGIAGTTRRILSDDSGPDGGDIK